MGFHAHSPNMYVLFYYLYYYPNYSLYIGITTRVMNNEGRGWAVVPRP